MEDPFELGGGDDEFRSGRDDWDCWVKARQEGFTVVSKHKEQEVVLGFDEFSFCFYSRNLQPHQSVIVLHWPIASRGVWAAETRQQIILCRRHRLKLDLWLCTQALEETR